MQFEKSAGADIVASNPIMVDNDADDQVPVDDLTPEEASRIIHSHRKVRYGKSGYNMRHLPGTTRANSASSDPSGTLSNCRATNA